jgi:hypothetical protein
MAVTLSPERTAKIEEASRPLAILWGMGPAKRDR